MENASYSERRTLRLGQEAREVLDLLRVPQSPGGCDRVVIDVGLENVESADLGGRRFRFSLWLVEEKGSARRTVDRAEVSIRQGQIAPYVFTSLAQAAAQGSPVRDGNLRTDISGTIRGRVRPDGLVDVSLHVWRSVRIDGVATTAGRGGTKTLVIRPSETIAVELPDLSGRVGDVDLEPYATGARTTILIQAKPLE